MWQSKCRTVQGPQAPISPGSSRPCFSSPLAPGTDDGACTELTLVSTGPLPRKTCCSVAGVRVPMNHPFLTDTPPGPQMQCVGAGPSPQSPPTYDAHPCSTISDAAGSAILVPTHQGAQYCSQAANRSPWKLEQMWPHVFIYSTALPLHGPDNSDRQPGKVELEMCSISVVFLSRASALLCCEHKPSSDSR